MDSSGTFTHARRPNLKSDLKSKAAGAKFAVCPEEPLEGKRGERQT